MFKYYVSIFRRGFIVLIWIRLVKCLVWDVNVYFFKMGDVFYLGIFLIVEYMFIGYLFVYL